MSQKKKQVRAAFRSAVFKRDSYACRCCTFQSTPEKAEDELDAHHITDRTEMPNGGYVPENGISVCAACHEKAECHHRKEPVPEGYAPADLYALIGSSYDRAVRASEKLSA